MPVSAQMTMTDAASDPALAALVASRICHDLISPIGAIGNGIELLSMSGGAVGPELALITESVGQANARIRLFRIAFGTAQPGQKIASAELRSVADELSRGSRVAVNWLTDGDTDRAEAKLACLLLLCVESALAFGGRIDVARDGPGWRISGSAARLRREDRLWRLLDAGAPGAGEQVAASEVQFPLAGALAARLGRRLATAVDDTGVTVAF